MQDGYSSDQNGNASGSFFKHLRDLFTRQRKAASAPALDVQMLEDRILYSATPLAMDAAALGGGDVAAEDLAQALQAALIEETQAEASPSGASPSTEAVFIDSSLDDLEILLQQYLDDDNVDVFLIDSDEDGIAFISETLAHGGAEYSSLHIVTHGSDGAIELGSNQLTTANANDYQTQLVSWSAYLTEDADILFYGCDIAETDEGQELLSIISTWTGADIAASDDLTGHASLGGDWELEFAIGQIQTSVIASAEVQNEWTHVLTTVTFQQGVGGYSDTQDTTLDSGSPTSNLGGSTSLEADLDDGSGQTQGLIRFDTIVGGGASQIPQNVQITSASLTVQVNNGSTGTISLYEMLNTWDESSGWADFNGLTVGGELASTPDAQISGVTGTQTFTGLESTVQRWVDGYSNYGWGILTNSTDGWDIYSSEGTTTPILSVTYIDPGSQASSAHTLTVDTANDVQDGDTTSIDALLANKGADGLISLREAIWAANNTTNFDGSTPDVINFAIGAQGTSHTIVLAEALPYLTDSVYVDALSQGGVGYTGNPLIEIDGSSTANFATSLITIWTGDSTVRGFALTGSDDEGIEIDGSNPFGPTHNNVIEYNWVGLDLSGNVGANADNGILVVESSSNTIIRNNVVAGNSGDGIEIRGVGVDGTIVEGNKIGVLADGSTVVANAGHGIRLATSVTNTRIGTDGTDVAAQRNTISGNVGSGINVEDVDGTVIDGNYIGTNSPGTLDRGNTAHGISVWATATNTVIGTAGFGNLISGNNGDGINSASNGLSVAANLIGLNAAGTAAIQNSGDGIDINGGTNSTIGGMLSTQRNIISGNVGFGIYMNSATSSNFVFNNYIGTNAAGTTAVANLDGIWLDGSSSNTIGQAGAGNLISGNTYFGLVLDGTGANNNIIQANFIGTDAVGTGVVANGSHGIYVQGGAHDNLLGGTFSGDGNLINGNQGDGISLNSNAGINNTVLGNQIFGNLDSGIDLGNDGVTANDGDVTGAGANNLQDFPVLSQADLTGGVLTLSGSLNNNAPVNTQFRVEFFGNVAGSQDATHGEGRYYLGSTTVTTDGSGLADFSGVMLGGVSLMHGDFVTATATRINAPASVGTNDIAAYGSTSEFAANRAIVATNSAPEIAGWYNDDWSYRKEIIVSAGQVSGDLVGFPILIDLNSDIDLANFAQLDGDDILFTSANGTTKLAHEIEIFTSGTGELTAWVKTDLSSLQDTRLYMYYGNAVTSNQQDATNVWDANYQGVWHLNDSPTGAAGEINDSTSNNNDGVTEGSMDASDLVDTKIGKGLDFDEVDDLIRISDSASLDSTAAAATFELWVNWDNVADGDHQILMTSSNRFTTGAHDGYEWASQGSGNHFYYPEGGTDPNYVLGTSPYTNGTWHHVALTQDFATKEVEIYVDGVAMSFGTDTLGTTWDTLANPDDWLWGGNPDRNTRYFDGMMDEIRVSNVVRSQAWIETSAVNQSDAGSFYVLGTAEFRDATLSDIAEDDVNSAGDTVASVIASVGGNLISDADNGSVEGIAVIAVDDSRGTWQFDSGSGWTDFGAVSETSARLLDVNAKIRFVPSLNYQGPAGDITFRAWDQTTGSNGGIADTSVSGGSTAFSTETDMASLNVTAMADAPLAVDDRWGLDFDGEDDYVTVGSDASLEMTNTMTMEAWVNPEASANTTRMIINKEGEYEVGIDGAGQVRWAFANTNPGWAWHDTGYTIANDVWSHIAVTYDNGTVSTFVNGVVVDVYNGSGVIGDSHASLDELRIGGRTNNPTGQFFVGKIDEVRIWNTARSQADIFADLDADLVGNEAGLAGYWRFNEGSGTSTADAAGINDGTLIDGGLGTLGPQWVGYSTDQNTPLNIAAGSGILANDIDLEGDSLTVTQVNGNVANVGSQFTLPSGANLTVQADGSFLYNPNSSFNYLAPGQTGTDSFTYQVDDGNGGTDSATVEVAIVGTNDAPTVATNAGLSVAEGSAGNTITTAMLNEGDVDDGGTGSIYTVTNVTDNGTLFLSGFGALALNDTFTQDDIDNNRISYTHNGGETASDAFGFTLADGGEDGASPATGTFNFTITAVNDAPVVAAPGSALSATEQIGLAIHGTGFSVTDPDESGGMATVTLDVGEGSLTIAAGDSGITISSGNGTSTVSIAGTFAQVNALLTGAGTGTITYLNNNDAPSASTTITVTVNDQGNTGSDPGLTGDATSEEGSANQTINIQATNDDPTNAGGLPSDITVTEDVSSNVDLSAVDFSDLDASSGSLTVTLTTSTGGNLSATAGTGITLGGTSTALTVSGSLADLNAYFNSASNITYLHGTAHTNGDNADTIQVEINDNGNTGSGGGTDINLGTVNVDIAAVNDDPTNAGSLPSDITVTEDISSNVDLSAVDFSDLDASSGSLTVTLTTSTGGNLSAAAGTGITLGGTSTALTISGSLADLNTYFNSASNITYLHGTAHTNGDNADTIQVEFNDNGNTGSGGGTDINLGTVNVDIDAVNDDPTNAGSLPSDITVTEDVSSNVDLSAVDFSDLDASSGNLTVTLTTSTGGNLSAAAGTGITLGGTSTALTISGSLADLNAYFNSASNITYLHGTAHTNGDNADTIQVEINDNGNTGSGGGTDINLGTVNVDITAVNDAPDLDNSGDLSLTGITEDDFNNSGRTVAQILASDTGNPLTDADAGALEGIAIQGASSTNGTWEYSTNGGSTWSDIGTVSDSSALLLRSDDLVRYVPNQENGSTPIFTFRGWDQTSGAFGTKVNVSTNGGSTAYSADIESVNITVSSVNDAPTITDSSVINLTGTNEDTISSPTDVNSIVSSAGWGDVDSGAVKGIAITGLTGNGTWQFSSDGTNWTSFGGVTGSNALLLNATAQVRYVPDSFNGETATFAFVAWDTTWGSASTSSVPSYADPGSGGGTTAFSSQSATAQIAVTNVNDAVVAVADADTAVEAGGLNNGTAGVDPTGNVLTNDNEVDTGDALNVTGVVAGVQASASGAVGAAVTGTYGSLNIAANGAYTYSVDNSNPVVQALRTSGQTITDTFTYTVQDSGGSYSSTQVVITIQGQNDAPIATVDQVTATEAGGLNNTGAGSDPTGNVLTNDSDVDATDSKTVTGVAQGVAGSASGNVASAVAGSYGSITINANGSFVYNVDNSNSAVQALRTTGDTLQDVFTYTMEDTDGVSSTTQVTVTIEGQNDDPLGNDDTAVAVEAGGLANGTAGTDATGNVLANDTDVDSGDTKTVVGVAAGSQGSAAGSVGNSVSGSYGSINIASDGSYTYSVDNNNSAVQALRTSGESLNEVFTYTMQDASGADATAEITVTITGSNDAPTAVANVATAIEASGINNNISGTDPSGNVLTNDTDVDAGDTKTVVGVATGVQVSTSGSVGVTVVGSYGSIVINPDGSYTYTVDNDNAAVEALVDGATLDETFSYTLSDTDGLESTTQIVITIDGRTDLPVAEADMVTGVEAGGIANGTPGSDPSGNVLDNDASNDGKEVVGVAAGSTGSASGSVGVSVVGLYGTVVINSDGTFNYTLDNNNATVQALLTAGDHVTDIFTYTMEDDFSNVSSTELTVTIDGQNDNPDSIDDTGIAVEAGGVNNGTVGSNATGNVLGNDTDVDSGDTKSVFGVAAGAVGSATGSVGASVTGTYGSIVINADGNYTYTVNGHNTTVQALRTSSDTLQEVYTYTMVDSFGASSSAQVTVTIQGSNDAPTAVIDAVDAYEAGGVANATAGSDPSGNLFANDLDVDSGDTQTVIGVALGVQGSASGSVGSGLIGSYGTVIVNSDGSYTYVVDNNNVAVQALRTSGQTLDDIFTYTMQDTDGLTSTTQLSVTLHGANDNVAAQADTATAVEAGGAGNGTAGTNPTGNVLTNDSDVDAGDTMNVSGVSAGIQASTSGSVGASVDGLYGAINIASDGSYSYTVDNDNPLVQDLLSSGDTLTDIFTYTVQDTAGADSTTQVTITIQGANDAPVANANFDDAYEAGGVANGTPGSNPSGNVLTNDDQVDAGDTWAITGVAQGVTGTTSGSVGATVNGSFGSITINSDGSYTYIVDNNNASVQALRTGSDTLFDVFSYTVDDGAGLDSTAQITITLHGENDAPVAVVDNAIAVEAGGLANGTAGTDPTGNVLTNDTDVDAGDSRTVAGVAAGVQVSASGNVNSIVAGSFGSITIDANGAFTYSVDNDNAAVQALATSSDTLDDVFTYTVVDTAGATSTQQITVTVQGQNDAPVMTLDVGDSAAESLSETDATLISGGTVTVNDVDLTDPVTSTVSSVSASGITTGLQSNNAGLLAMLTSTANVLDGTEVTDTLTWNFNSGSEAFDYLAAGESLTLTYTITVTDSQGATDTQYVVITINGTGDAPVVSIQGSDSAAESINETDTTLTSSGTLTVTDSDLTDVVTSAVSSVASSGTTTGLQSNNAALLAMLSSTASVLDGTEITDTLTWDFNSGSEAFDYLAVGESLTLTYTISVTDSQGATDTQDVVITVNGTGDAPVVTMQGGDSTADTLIETDATLTSSGTLTVADSDLSDVVTSAVSSVASSGTTTGLQSNNAGLLAMFSSTMNIIDGNELTDTLTWDFNSGSEAFDYLAVGESLTLTYTITVTDSQGATDTQDVVITVNGTGDAPVVTLQGGDSSADTLIETDATLTSSGTLTVSDVDLTDVVTSAVSSVASSGTTTGLQSDNTALLAMFSSTVNVIDGTELTDTLTWGFNSDSEAFDYLAVGESLTLTYTITVTDSQGATDTQDVSLTINGTLDNPAVTLEAGDSAAANLNETNASLTGSGTVTVADADMSDVVTSAVSNVTASGNTSGLQSNNAALLAMLSSTASVLDGTEVTDKLTWDFNSGSEGFDYLAVGESLTLTYTITVTDSQGATDTQDVVITINGTGDAPVVTLEVGDSAAESLSETDTTLWSSGTLTVSDSDLTDVVTSTVSSVTAGGTTTGLQSNNAALLAMLTSTANVLDSTELTDILTWGFNSGSEAFDYLAVGESLTLTYTLTVTDSQGATDTQNVTLTINGTGDAPVVSLEVGDSASDSLNETDTTLTSSGTVTVSDLDLSDIVTSAVSTVGTSGTTTGLQSNNAALLAMLTSTTNVLDGTELTDPLTWDFNSGSEAFDYLAVGESLTLTYTITVTDSQGATDTQDVVITIHGTNDALTVNLDTATAVEAGGYANGTAGTNPTGNVLSNDTDADASNTLTVSGVAAGVQGFASGNVGASVVGSYGTILVNSDGSYSYTVNNSNGIVQVLRTAADTLDDVFTYTASDPAGATSTTQITVTIQGNNDAPDAVDDMATAVEAGGLANGTAGTNPTGNVLSNDGDLDSGDTQTVNGVASGTQVSASGSVGSVVAGSYGSLTINADGSYSYVVDNSNASVQALRTPSDTLTDVYTYTIIDTAGAQATSQFTITIEGQNDNPVAADDDYSTSYVDALVVVPQGITVNDLDVDMDTLTTVLISGPATGTLVFNANGSLSYTPVAGFVGEVYVQYLVTDGTLSSNTATITIDITEPTNLLPPPVDDGGNDSGDDDDSGDPIESESDEGEFEDNDSVEATTTASGGNAGVGNLLIAADDGDENPATKSLAGRVQAAKSNQSEKSINVDGVNVGEVDEFLRQVGSSALRVQELSSLRLQSQLNTLQLGELISSHLVFAEVHEALEDDLNQDFFAQLDPMVTAAIGTGLVIWLINAGQVAAAVLSTASTFVQLDPLTVLQNLDGGEVAETSEEKMFDATHTDRPKST